MAKEVAKPAQKPQGGAKPAAAKAQGKKGAGAPQAAPAAKGRPKGTGEAPARLKETFHKTVVPALMKERGYTNPFEVPRLEKIVINMGVGEGRENAKVLDFATDAPGGAPSPFFVRAFAWAGLAACGFCAGFGASLAMAPNPCRSARRSACTRGACGRRRAP